MEDASWEGAFQAEKTGYAKAQKYKRHAYCKSCSLTRLETEGEIGQCEMIRTQTIPYQKKDDGA